MRRFLALLLLCLTPSFAAALDRPFDPPPELRTYVRKVTFQAASGVAKAEAFLRACFQDPAAGGLGITYDNDYTRTVEEVWRDRKANCLSMTAFYIAACKTIGLEAVFAESPSVSQWRRVGPVIRHELHVVAVVKQPPLQDVVADFLPEMRKGFYVVRPMSEPRARALFYSNRAVERLEANQVQEAQALAKLAVAEDQRCGSAWNILGVLEREQGDLSGAEQAFQNAVALNREDGAALGNLEALYRSQGQIDLSMTYRRLALKARAEDPYFQAFLGQEAIEAGDLDQAVKCLEKAIRLQKFEPEFYLQLSRVHQLRGRANDAMDVLSKGYKLMDPREQSHFQSKIAKLRASV